MAFRSSDLIQIVGPAVLLPLRLLRHVLLTAESVLPGLNRSFARHRRVSIGRSGTSATTAKGLNATGSSYSMRTIADLSRQGRLIEQAHDAILIRSGSGTILFWNRGAERLYGWSREEALGRSSHELLKPSFPVPLAEIHGSLTHLGSWDGELIHEDRGGCRVVVASRWIVDRDESDQEVILEINRDITEQKKAEDRLRRSESALREAQKLARIGSWEWEPETDVVTWSDELYSIMGRDPSLPPPSFAEHSVLYAPESLTRLRTAVGEALRSGTPYEIELELIGEGRRPRWIIARGQPVVGPDGEVVKLYGTAQDATERRDRILELRAAHDQALAATRAKSDFLAQMSHEIRTPMNGILGMVELMLETPLGERQREYVETIRTSGEGLLTVINDILDFAKVEAGKLSLEYADFDPRSLIAEVIDLLGHAARQKGLAINSRIDQGVPTTLQGDANRIRQILINLAGNAIKYTDRGEVSVEAIAVATVGDDTTLRIRIQDTGIGIPEDRLGRIFESFCQVDARDHRRRGGTGLGLAISRNLVEMMGGTLGVESEPGRGSTFWFELTLRGRFSRDHLARPHAAGCEHAAEPLGLHVLLAEDNEINRRVAIGMVERLGCRVDTVENGRQAIEALDYDRHDLVLMDVQMPDLDGIGATRAIRSREKETGRRIPIIALTAHAMKMDRDRCLDAGMDGYLAKPIRSSSLREAIDRGIARGRGIQMGCVKKPRLGDPDPIEFVRRSCGKDANLTREVISMFLEATPLKLRRVEHAIQSRDGQKLAWEGHALKGTFLTLGSPEIAASFGELTALGERGEIDHAERVYPDIRERIERFSELLSAYLGRNGPT